MFNSFRLSLSPAPQILDVPDGLPGSASLRLTFSEVPSSGTVTIEGRRGGLKTWSPIARGANASVTGSPLVLSVDGGYSGFRVTFSGLTGGVDPVLSVVGNPTAMPPSDLLTDSGFGPSRRLRVDPGQTGFFAGRMFRSYIEASIPVSGPAVQFRFTSPVDFILWSQKLELTQGALALRVFTGAVESGTWVDRPSIGVNRMAERPSPSYVGLARLATGGNFTGGTEVDLLKVRASAANNTASNVGGESSERGLPAGVYHGRIETLTGGVAVNDSAQAIYSLLWEERA